MNLLNDEQFCSVSPRGDMAAWCNSDGFIRFYDCLTGAIQLEYSSSSHLKGVCTCLEWSRFSQPETVTKSLKKAKTSSATSSVRNELKDPNLVAIGTSEGSVLIYHLAKASLHTILQDDSVSTKINDLCWAPNQSIYSCTDEGSIVEWNPAESKLTCKWKASKTCITAILVDSKSEYLLSASRSIAVWDLSTKTKLKTLTGHSNDIFKLLNLNNRITANHESQIVNDYFISAALNDRVINTWVLKRMLLPISDLAQSSSSSLVSFSVNDTPVYIDVVNLNIKEHNDTVAILIVITSKGGLHLYVSELVSPKPGNNKSAKKPTIKPIRQVSIESKENVPLKINAAFLCNSKNERVDLIDIDSISSDFDLATSVFKSLASQAGLFVVYGSSVNPRIEKLGFEELTESKTRLVREDPSKAAVSIQVQNTKIETPAVSKDLQVLVPSMVGPQVGNIATSVSNKRKSKDTNQMTLEEKLDLMGINNTNEGTNGKSGSLPKTDNLLVLLVQGLQSNDSKTLNHVLQHKNEKVINKTVSLLPSQYVMSLVKELTQRLQGHAQSGLSMIKWLKAVLMIHTSFLMSYPELVDSLGKLYESMNARTKLFPQLSKLQGKLQLAISQISSQSDKAGEGGGEEKDRQELLYYQESTSEDEQIEDDLIPSHSEELDADEFLFSDEEEDSTQEEIGTNANS